MPNAKMNVKSRVYQTSVTIAGLGVWLIAAAALPFSYTAFECLIFLLLMPLAILFGKFIHTFPLPSGLKFTQNKVSFSLADAFVLLIACWFGAAPAVFIAGVEGFASARQTSKRLSVNLFSSSMMSLAATASAITLHAVLNYVFNETQAGGSHSLTAVSIAIFIASVVQLAVNINLLSMLLALRYEKSPFEQLKDFMMTVPVFLPTSAAASLMYFALQHGVVMLIVIAGPVIAAIYLGHRQSRDGVQKRIEMMEKAHRETIEALAVTINAKDEVTHEHVLRVQIYAAGVASLLGCSQAEIEALKAGALLHDVGKIAVPDYILNKPGKLTAEEFEKMKMHTVVGAQILGRVEFPYPVVPIVRHHHERWDGKGYPDGLKGEEIPLTARIISVVDCFDALREDRQYRRALSREEAIELLMQGSGTQFDPRVVGTFVTHLPQFEAEIIAHKDTLPTFGIEPIERLSEAARAVAPAAGLAESPSSDVAIASDKTASAKPKLKHEELLALYDLAQAINAARSREEMTRAFVAHVKTIAPFDTCALTLFAPETARYMIAQAAGEHAALIENRIIAAGEGITGWVIANRKQFCNNDPKLDLPATLATPFAAYRTLAAFPIIKGEDLHGAITLYSAALDKYTPEHQRMMNEAANLLAVALSSLSQTPTHGITNNVTSSSDNKWIIFGGNGDKIAGELESELAH
jgi:putative nucleotidyltransferase with HDIG domain